MTTIPEDVKAYMTQAATEIAKEQGFVPENENVMTEWLMTNRVAICERASKLMWALLEKMKQPEVTSVLSASTWARVRNSENNRIANRAINDALA